VGINIESIAVMRVFGGRRIFLFLLLPHIENVMDKDWIFARKNEAVGFFFGGGGGKNLSKRGFPASVSSALNINKELTS